jgi:flagellin-specific chaperone FliS
LPSKTHKALYQSLGDITSRITATLDEEDTSALRDLATEHKRVMGQLRQAGFSQETGLLHQVEETRDQVQTAIEQIIKQRDDLCHQLVMFEKKKKASAAYSG